MVLNEPWSMKETAALLNWIDHCVVHNKDFRGTVTKSMYGVFGTLRTWQKVQNKLNHLLTKYTVRTYADGPARLWKEGTYRITSSKTFPGDLFAVMNEGRRALDIPLLDGVHSIPRNITVGDQEGKELKPDPGQGTLSSVSLQAIMQVIALSCCA
jgi:hypothetical protein